MRFKKHSHEDIWKAIDEIMDLLDRTLKEPITDNAKIIEAVHSSTQKAFMEVGAEVKQLKQAVAELQIVVKDVLTTEEK